MMDGLMPERPGKSERASRKMSPAWQKKWSIRFGSRGLNLGNEAKLSEEAKRRADLIARTATRRTRRDALEHGQGLLHDFGRPERCGRRRHQEGVSQGRGAVAPGQKPERHARRGQIQGDRGGVRRAERPDQTCGVRPIRRGGPEARRSSSPGDPRWRRFLDRRRPPRRRTPRLRRILPGWRSGRRDAIRVQRPGRVQDLRADVRWGRRRRRHERHGWYERLESFRGHGRGGHVRRRRRPASRQARSATGRGQTPRRPRGPLQGRLEEDKGHAPRQHRRRFEPRRRRRFHARGAGDARRRHQTRVESGDQTHVSQQGRRGPGRAGGARATSSWSSRRNPTRRTRARGTISCAE